MDQPKDVPSAHRNYSDSTIEVLPRPTGLEVRLDRAALPLVRSFLRSGLEVADAHHPDPEKNDLDHTQLLIAVSEMIEWSIVHADSLPRAVDADDRTVSVEVVPLRGGGLDVVVHDPVGGRLLDRLRDPGEDLGLVIASALLGQWSVEERAGEIVLPYGHVRATEG